MSTIQGLPIAEPEEVGLSSERLARIRPRMQKYIDRQEVPCVVTLVTRHGKVAHFEAQGFMDIETKVPVAKDTIFRLASMTKPVTAVAALMLHEEGHYMLDDPISKFLPEFKNPRVTVLYQPVGEHWPHITALGNVTVPALREITIHDCLTNMAGFASGRRTPIGMLGPYAEAMRGTALMPLPPRTAEPTVSVRETVERLAKVPLDFHPGTAWEYSSGLDVAGVLVEIVSGETLDEFMRERIFEPLGMHDTSFYLTEDKLSRFPRAYATMEEEGEWKLVEIERPEDSEKVKGPKVRFSGAWGLLSTAPDFARFAQMLLNGGVLDGVRLLGRKTVELMTTNHTGDFPIHLAGPGYGYGLGVFVRTSLTGTPLVGSVGTYGWGGAWTTWYFADPKEDMFGLLLTQVRGYWMNPHLIIESDFERLAYQALI